MPANTIFMEQIYSFAVFENELQKLKYNSFLGNFCNSKGVKKIKKKKNPSGPKDRAIRHPGHSYLAMSSRVCCSAFTDHVLLIWSGV